MKSSSRRPHALVALATLSLLGLAACGDGSPSTTARAGDSAASRDPGRPAGSTTVSAAGAIAPSSPTGSPPGTGLAPNELGRIPVLEYHVIGGEKNALYTRTVASFKQDLEEVYARGYRPITIAQMLDKDFRDVPAGMSPVVFVFDDASPEQFSYVERDGRLEVDSNSAIGIWLAFQRRHPDWKSRGTFCLLNGAGAGHDFFGNDPKWNGQKKEWRYPKVKWLADQGFELCAHTLWHARLDKYDDPVVQEQIARNLMGIDSAVAGYRVRTIALPYGKWPKNRPLAWKGSWTDPRTKRTHAYEFDAVLEVAGGPTRSPYDPQFNPHSILRVQAIGDDIRRTLAQLDQSKTRFVSDGNQATVARAAAP